MVATAAAAVHRVEVASPELETVEPSQPDGRAGMAECRCRYGLTFFLGADTISHPVHSVPHGTLTPPTDVSLHIAYLQFLSQLRTAMRNFRQSARQMMRQSGDLANATMARARNTSSPGLLWRVARNEEQRAGASGLLPARRLALAPAAPHPMGRRRVALSWRCASRFEGGDD